MSEWPHYWVPPLVSALLVAIGSWVAIASTIARLAQRLADMSDETNRRLERMEKAVGITNGAMEGAFVRRNECLLMERAVGAKLDHFETEIKHLTVLAEQNAKRLEHLEQRIK